MVKLGWALRLFSHSTNLWEQPERKIDQNKTESTMCIQQRFAQRVLNVIKVTQ
jgi:hypothetical protein